MQRHVVHSRLVLPHSRHQGLVSGAAASLACSLAPAVRLIDLHNLRQSVAAHSHHRTSQRVKLRLWRMVLPRLQHALKSKALTFLFWVRRIPDRTEPQPKRLPPVMENRPRLHRRVRLPGIGACRSSGLSTTPCRDCIEVTEALRASASRTDTPDSPSAWRIFAHIT